jgi:putative transcriptional regulator
MISFAPCLPGDGWRLGLERLHDDGAPVHCRDERTVRTPLLQPDHLEGLQNSLPPHFDTLWEGRDPSDGNAGEAPMNNKLKVLRAMRNWSQAELADRLDVSRQAVNAIETGKYDPSLPLAFKLARLFEMPIEEIFDDGHQGNDDD